VDAKQGKKIDFSPILVPLLSILVALAFGGIIEFYSLLPLDPLMESQLL